MIFWFLVIDEVGLVLDEEAWYFDIGAHIGIFLDDLLPLDGLVDGGNIDRRAHNHAS